MITYQRLWETMKKRGITQYHLIKRQPPFTNFVGDFKVYFLNTEQKCL